jgi:hypothetical protein
MKKLILGLDGMDFDLAVDLNLENTLQMQFDKISVPIDKHLGYPVSPEVWASFLCGEHVESKFDTVESFLPFKRLLKYVIRMKRFLPFISLGIGRKIAGNATGFQRLDRKTWIDLPNVKEINSPFYSYKNDVFVALYEYRQNNDFDLLKRKFLDIFETHSKELFDFIKAEVENPECDLLFAYHHFPDMFNHLWYDEPEGMFELNRKVDKFAGQVKDLVGDIHTIIMSDHGFDSSKGHHSNMGFISSNKFMNFPKDIIGLGKLMYEYAGANK